MAQIGTNIGGRACRVTAGPNRGKTGTYTRDWLGRLQRRAEVLSEVIEWKV